MNISNNKGVLVRLVQQLVTIQSYIYSWNIIEWQSFQNFAIVWLNLRAIYLHFFVSHTNNKKAPREYYIFLFFPYSITIKELIRAPENSMLARLCLFLKKLIC